MVDVVGGDVTADAALAAGQADDDLVADHQRRPGDVFPNPDVRVLDLPDLHSGLRVEREHLSVEGDKVDPTVGVVHAAGLRAATVELTVGAVGGEASGELCTRGYLVMLGYWNQPEATAGAIDDAGWMHSEDLATMDVEGYLKIICRI